MAEPLGGTIRDPLHDLAASARRLPTVAPDEVRFEVPPDALASTCTQLAETGGRWTTFVGLDERDEKGGFEVEAVVALPGGPLVRLAATLPADEPAYPAITRHLPAAHWDEREAKDLLGIVPVGHPDPRRLVLHERYPRGYHPLRRDVPADVRPETADRRFTPLVAQGDGVYQLAVGPIHAGVIEPGGFRFSAVGESVLHLDARLFYTHRGLEKLVEGRTFTAALPIVERACGVCTVAHATAFSRAVERATGTEVPARARWARLLLAELERLYNHVGDLSNICGGVGFHYGTSRLGWLKERLLRLNEGLAGHRYLMGVVSPGGLRADLDPAGLAALPTALDAVADDLAGAVRALLRSEGLATRLHGTGIVPRTTAEQLGALGVAARASGIAVDLRRDRPDGAYAEVETPEVEAAAGDVAARLHVRAQETRASIALIREALGRLPDGPVTAPVDPIRPGGMSALGGSEGPRGASWVWLAAAEDGTIRRLHLRSASFANWPVVAAAVPGNLVPDFPLINKSFELCYACTDR